MYPYLHLFGKAFGTYGLLMGLAVVVAVLLSIRRGKRFGLVLEDILIVGGCAVVSGLAGAKLLYLLVTFPLPTLWELLLQGDFSLLLGSGTVFLGGLLGALPGALLGLKLSKCTFAAIEQAVVPWLPLAHAIGRVGCFMAGCCHGAPYTGPLAVYYPHSVQGLPPDQGYFPIQLAEALWNLLLCLALLYAAKKVRRPLSLLACYFALYAVGRFLLEFFRGDAVRGFWLGISVSQWISLGMLVFSVIWLLYSHKKGSRSQPLPKTKP